MDGREHPDTSDEFDVEVSDVRRSRGDATATPPARSPFQPRRTPRRRLVRLAVILSTGVLALVVVLSSISAVRDGTAGLASRLLPPPTPTLAPGNDLFSMLPNPPGVDVSLDGHVLAHLPFPGDAHPLRLSPAHHVFAWQSHLFPFPPLACMVSVPSLPTDTCPVVDADTLQLPPGRPALGRVILLHAALNASGYAFGQLATAVQGALDASQSSALVQPGELYYLDPLRRSVVATQPLHALLSYQSIHVSGGPCEPRDPALPCRFPGQDCADLCTVPQPPSTVARAPGEWIAAALVRSLWRYTTLGGQVVADLITAFLDQFAVLRITWDGSEWHVTPLLGNTPGLPATDDLVCAPARYWLEHNGR